MDKYLVTPKAAITGRPQIETATVLGTIGAAGAGNARVTVTASGLSGSPKVYAVAVANNDTATQVATKIRAELELDSALTTMFAVGGSGAEVSLTRLVNGANDETLNIAIANDTCTGLTAAPTSLDTQSGIADDSDTSFPEIHEDDLGRVGQNAMAGDAAIVDDFIRKPGATQFAVEGGDYVFAGGLKLDIAKPLRAWRGSDGAQFADQDSSLTTVELSPAHESLDRIDLIYAATYEDADGAPETRHFKKDPADANSLEGDVGIYTEKQNKLVITVVTGEADSVPVTPAVPDGGIPLYYVVVPAGVLTLSTLNVQDVRYNFWTLEEIAEIVANILTTINDLELQKHRHPATDIDVALPAAKVGDTAQEVLDYLVSQSDDETTDPIMRPELVRHDNPALAPSNPASGKLGSVGVLDGATPAVDFPMSRDLVFSNVTRKILPGNFPTLVEGTNINARIVNKHVNEATQSRSNTIALRLSNIDDIESDGGGDWVNLNAAAPQGIGSYVLGRRVVGRDSRYIEIFGGGQSIFGAGGGDDSWYTFDTQTKTYTARSFSGDVPTYPIQFAAPCGDGTALIMSSSGVAVQWYLVNLTTGVTVQKTVNVPAASPVLGGAIGDLVQTNIVLIAVSTSSNGIQYYIYHVDAGSFEAFTPVGGPVGDFAGGFLGFHFAFFQPGQGLLFYTASSTRNGSQTLVFDYPSRSFSTLVTPPPAAGVLGGGEMANVNGRVLFIMGDLISQTEAKVWEIKPGGTPKWTAITTGLPNRTFPGLGSLLIDGLPKGHGYFFGGLSYVGSLGLNNDAWGFEAGGVIEVSCGGQTGLSLGPGTTTATFRVTSISLPWAVGTVLSSIVGLYTPGSVRVQYSFDNGATRVEVPLGRVTTIVGSPVNPTPFVYITLIGQGICVSQLNELFEQAGGGAPGLTEVVLRFNAIGAGVRYMYMDRDGTVSFEAALQQTTIDKARLMKITPNGASAPTPFDYVNKRLIHRKYTGTKSGADPSFANDFPVLPSYIRASGVVDSGKHLYSIADPTVTDDTPIVVTGLTTSDQYIVELEA